MSAPAQDGWPDERRRLLVQLNDAWAADDRAGFDAVLDQLLCLRESTVLTGIQRLSESLLSSLARFQSSSRLATLAAQDIPDARVRLDHVLDMTESAAHTTLGLIERTVPLADSTVRKIRALLTFPGSVPDEAVRAFFDETIGNFEVIRHNLTEMMLTQGFQDLTGQILRGVKALIGEVEEVLAELATLTGVGVVPAPRAPADGRALEGPAVPGVTRGAIACQDDVDELIAGLGI